MILKLSFLVVVVLQIANAQVCVPGAVHNVTLDPDYTLHWAPVSNCDSIAYLVYIHLNEDDLQYIYTALEPSLNVSFLPACERFYFEVNAFVDNELGEAGRLASYIPAPSGANLTITFFNATVQGNNSTFLNWQVVDQFAHCARAFRIVIGDTYSILPRDVYTERNFLFLDDLIPCGVYTFGVMAIYNLASEGPISLIDYLAPQQKADLPVLESVNQEDTSISLSWSLPSYQVNRCPITSLEIEGLPFLHESYPIEDSPERPLFTSTISDLQPDNMYMLRVTVVNSAGPSDVYPIGVQTLPAA